MPWSLSSRTLSLVLLICVVLLAGAKEGSKKDSEGKRASSRVALGKTCSLAYLGAFLADGGFRGRSRLRLGEFVDTVAGQPDAQPPDVSAPTSDDVAPAKQRVVQDYEPGAHPVETVNGRPVLADVVDAIASFVEEHQAAMDAPQSVSTDSAGRLIVADPSIHAVHVLEFRGKTSFRIQGGKDRRLQTPAGVASDPQGNIYVSDTQRGMVLVYDHLGRFRHYLGKVKGEAFFERPEGLAVDASASRLYVADTPRNTIAALDLRGQVLGSFGDARGGRRQFNKPTSILLRHNELFVLDSSGSRVQVFDLNGKLLRQVKIAHDDTSPLDHPGFAVDSRGNTYVSDELKGIVRVYNQAGRLLNIFGRKGNKIGEFSRPSGLWADAHDRIYVADPGNHRVQVFQFRARGEGLSCE